MKVYKSSALASMVFVLAACDGTSVTSSQSMTPSSVASSSSVGAQSSLPAVSSVSSLVSSSAPNVVTQTLTIQESENGFCSNSGIIDNQHMGYTGTGFADTVNEEGASIVWAVNAPKSGNYGVIVRYANGGTDPRSANLSIDESAYTTQLSLGLTGEWASWQTEATSISLIEGNNTVRLTATTAAGAANIDSISFEGEGLAVGQCDSGSSSSDAGASSSMGSVVIGDAPGAYPAPGASDVNPDAYLRITFDNTPSIKSGTIDIYDASNNQKVDSINVGQESDSVGTRTLNTWLVSIAGNTVVINPHAKKLSYGKTYNVVINSGVLTGVINGQNYNGVSGTQWQFRTKSSAPTSSMISVDDNGPADFGSLQGALDYIQSKHGGSTSAQISVKNGIYPELLDLKNKSNLRVVGESRDNTVVRARNGNTINSGSTGRSMFVIAGGDLITLENMTFHNSATRGGGDGQAEALYFNSGNRLIVKNTAFYSEQDTILTKGYPWFYQSLISGNVDFIWGYPKAALFEESEIRSIGDSKSPGSDAGGYVLQSRSPAGELGFVFLNSSFTRGKGPAGNTPGNGKSTLGRGANKTDSYDSAAFINCKMDSHIKSEGFDKGRELNPKNGTAILGYREYGSTTLSGNAINLDSRFSAYKLNANEVNQYYSNRAKIFSSFNNGQGWNPTP